MRPYERLLAWRHCHRLALFVYRVTESFPESRVVWNHLSDAACRGVCGDEHRRGICQARSPELRRFLDVTLGSLSELSYLALLARDLRLFAESDWREFDRLHAEAGKTTMGLYKAITRRIMRADAH